MLGSTERCAQAARDREQQLLFLTAFSSHACEREAEVLERSDCGHCLRGGTSCDAQDDAPFSAEPSLSLQFADQRPRDL